MVSLAGVGAEAQADSLGTAPVTREVWPAWAPSVQPRQLCPGQSCPLAALGKEGVAGTSVWGPCLLPSPARPPRPRAESRGHPGELLNPWV